MNNNNNNNNKLTNYFPKSSSKDDSTYTCSNCGNEAPILFLINYQKGKEGDYAQFCSMLCMQDYWRGIFGSLSYRDTYNHRYPESQVTQKADYHHQYDDYDDTLEEGEGEEEYSY